MRDPAQVAHDLTIFGIFARKEICICDANFKNYLNMFEKKQILLYIFVECKNFTPQKNK